MQQNFDYYIEKAGVAETSKQCYKELREEGVISQRHREYLQALWERQIPSTDSEVAFSLGKLDPNYVRPRRFELQNELGLVSECNPKQCGVSGRMAKTFWFTELGLRMVGDK